MDSLFLPCGLRRAAAFTLAAALLLCPAHDGGRDAVRPVFFSLLFPQLVPQWMLLPWEEAEDDGLEWNQMLRRREMGRHEA